MHVVGTAGHVDHGKSALVHVLTGIDPDRLAEEKRRGLTIDLGFAWLNLPSGREVGIVDVPGHERFIRNMLAGAGAVNAALFVVAANEGWMPQSQEHLDILDLLGIGAGVVAVTKSDTVEKSRIEEVARQVKSRLSSTTLAAARIIAVSAHAGVGIEDLKGALDNALDGSPPSPDLGRPRLWIDRVFTMKGSGTVVTGTLIGGSIERNQEVEILPGGVRARVRSIQSHRKAVDAISPGNRTALNLVGVEPHQLSRGDIVSAPGLWRPTRRIGVRIRFLPHLRHAPAERGAFKFYSGSGETGAAVRFVADPEEGLALMLLDHATVLDFEDRFVIRDAGRRETIGGGAVLEPHAPAIWRTGDETRRRLSARETAGRAGRLSVLLSEEGQLHLHEIGIRAPGSEDPPDAVALPSYLVDGSRFSDLRKRILDEVRRYQEESPLSAGLPLTLLRSAIGFEEVIVDEVVAAMAAAGEIVEDETVVKTPDFAPAIDEAESRKLLDAINLALPAPPTLGELRKGFDEELVRALVRSGALVRVSPDLVFPSEWIDSLKERVRALIEDSGPMTVASFRDAMGTTRKYAVPLLEYLDQTGFTRRQGDTRILTS